MVIRQLIRGSIEWDRLESVMLEVAHRYDEESLRVEFLEADNWLSVPCRVNDQWFVKVISNQHALVHTFITTGRNLGALSSGQMRFFEHVQTPIEMAQQELRATRTMRDIGINVPEPIEAFEHDGLGVLVVEYLNEFRTLSDLPDNVVEQFVPDLFASLAQVHDVGLAHGDLRAANVLIANDELYLIDATNVRNQEIGAARAYDLACALAALEPHVGPRVAVGAAAQQYTADDLLAARDFLDFVNMRPDHDFDAAGTKGEIEKNAAHADESDAEQ
ncbi:RIO1 family regulatory kinase/ATPase domain-containing protein [Halocatena pleomorpha]|uniref:non-specific serine/threonine protein kinase n=1 Tax=Halocatena pleomorpha TaxID=1785090 RepID=A0A3P3R7P6_9EURY|nr:RIO1 family regulatory kinase/ATPase [Halocatena pleomorpha]RRJ29048.1 protein kinase family protein [Halocatena pleomorpha]